MYRICVPSIWILSMSSCTCICAYLLKHILYIVCVHSGAIYEPFYHFTPLWATELGSMFFFSFSIAIQKYPCKVKRNWKYINNTYTHHFGDYLNLYIITFCGVILKYIQVINVFKTNLRFFITIIYFMYPCVKIWLNRVHPIKPVTCLLLFVPI